MDTRRVKRFKFVNSHPGSNNLATTLTVTSTPTIAVAPPGMVATTPRRE